LYTMAGWLQGSSVVVWSGFQLTFHTFVCSLFLWFCLFPISLVCSIWRLISWSFVIRRNCYRSIVREGGDSLSFFVQPSVYR
jgi:hypothetical protein